MWDSRRLPSPRALTFHTLVGMDVHDLVAAALRKRSEVGGGHLHHSACIHNLPPEEQVALHGKTVDWWVRMIGTLPEQIKPNDWETEPPVTELPQPPTEG